MSKRILSVILLICMLVNNLPVAALAEESTSGCSHVCDENCGYVKAVDCDKEECQPAEEGGEIVHVDGCAFNAGSPCNHKHNGDCGVECVHTGGTATCTAQAVCDTCGKGYGEKLAHTYGADGKCTCGDECEHNYAEGVCTVCSMAEPAPTCDCTVKCAEGAVNETCPVCSADGADLTNCIGQKPETEAPVVTVSQWEWVDQEEIYNTDRAVAELAGVGSWEDVKSLLPAAILVNGEEVVLTWEKGDFDEIPGTYTLTATLPEGYVLADGSTPLTLTLEMGLESALYDQFHIHSICLDKECSDTSHNPDWQPWNETTSLPTKAGSYYLTNHVTLSSAWEVPGEVNLCLNGKTISLETGYTTRAFYISDGKTLSLTDCQGNGKITGFDTRGNGGAVYSEGTFTMYGGIISGNKVTNRYYNEGMGGGVYSSGTFTMHGGTISDNVASFFGGGVYVASGKQFTMYGGTISGNEVTTTGNAYKYGGGGVYSDGTFTMSGGTIKNNKANTIGGGVCISNVPNSEATSSFAMSGGEIIDNKAPNGGGVYIDSRKQFTMSGGTISRNTNSAYGGGVRVNGTFTMSNGTISDNVASYGGGVYLITSASFTMTGGKITGNTAATNGGGVYMPASATAFNLSGSPIISGNTGGNCYIENKSDCFMNVTGALSENAKIGITAWSSWALSPFCKPAESVDLSNYKNWFFSDSIDHAIAKNNDGSLYATKVDTYALNFDSTQAKVTVRGIETRKAAKGDIVVISPKGDAVVESVAATGCTVIKNEDGTYSFTMPASAVTITVTFKSSMVNVTGVTLDPETLALTVGDAAAQLTAIVEPENATNKNVSWTSSNTEVATVDETGKVTAVGAGTATITVTTEDGSKTATCAVTVTAAAVDPSTEITKAQTENGSFEATYNAENNTVTVTPAPAEGYEVDKVTYTPAGGTETEVTPVNGVYSFSKPDGEITVKVLFKETAPAGHFHSINGSDGDQEWIPIQSLDDIKNADYYCLENDVSYSGEWQPISGTVLCLNGHSIDFKGNGYVNVPSGVSFTLTDCRNQGTITGGTGRSSRGGGAVYVEGNFTMYGGKITGNTGSNGGGVYARKGTFTMYGGIITGNHATIKGGGVYVHDTGKFCMYGGEVSSNTTDNTSGDVHFGTANTVEVAGAPKIGILFIANAGNPLNIGASGLKPDAAITVAISTGTTSAKVAAANDTDYSEFFKSWNNAYVISYNANKEIQLAKPEKHTVKFIVDQKPNGNSFTQNVEHGNTLPKPSLADGNITMPGYTLVGWCTDQFTLEQEWDFAKDITQNLTLHAKLKLNPANIDCSDDYTDTYDEQSHQISVTASHNAYDNMSQYFTYQWYKDGKDEGNKIENATNSTYDVTDVADSGIYYCKVTASDKAFIDYPAKLALTSEAWSDPITVTISKADQAAPTNLGHEDETIAQKADGKITGLNSDMEYKRSADTVYTPVTGATLENLAAGEYHIRYKEQPNYNASEPVSITIAKGRMLTVTLPDQPVGYTLAVSGGGKAEAVYNGEIKLELSLAEGYERNESFRLTATNNTGVTEENGSFTISGITDDVEISVTGIVDVAFPTAEITVATNKWSSFLKDITFGIFFKETQTVTIDAQDVGSGVKTIEYYLSETEMSLDQGKAIRTWSGYNGSFSIDAEKQYVIYAKVTDNAENGGNTVYINSDGIVMDKTAPIFSGVTDGNEYYTTQKVTVTETNLASLTCDGTPVTLPITDPITLEGNKDNTYEIVATDKAGNTSAITVIMHPVEDLAAPLPEDTTLELDDKEEIEALKANVSSIWANNLSNITDEEEAALKAIIARCDALLQIIANVNNVNDQIKALKAPAEISPDEIDVILAYDDALEAYEKLTKRGKELVDTNELAKLEAVGKALTAYNVIKGHKSSYVKGSFKTISIVANGYYDVFGKYADGAFGKFREVRIDGEFLDPQYYTAASGSTVITLKTSYLESLETGKHYIQFVYVDGSTDGNDYFRVSVNNGSPMTGDNSHILMFTGMAVTSLLCAAMLIVFFSRKKGKYER